VDLVGLRRKPPGTAQQRGRFTATLCDETARPRPGREPSPISTRSPGHAQPAQDARADRSPERYYLGAPLAAPGFGAHGGAFDTRSPARSRSSGHATKVQGHSWWSTTNPLNREMLVRRLLRMDLPRAAPRRREAAGDFAREPFDLVLLDILMPVRRRTSSRFSRTTRWCSPGKSSLGLQDGAWHIPEKSPICARSMRTCGAGRGKAAVHGGEFARPPSGAMSRASTGTFGSTWTTRTAAAWCGTENAAYKSEPCFSAGMNFNPQGFRWLACHDAEGSVLAYLRPGSV